VPASVLELVSVPMASALVALALAPAEKDLGLVMDHSTKEKLLKAQGSKNH